MWRRGIMCIFFPSIWWGGNDSRIYNGQSLAFDPTGQLLARGKAFEEDVLVVDTSQGPRAAEPLCKNAEEAAGAR